MPVKSVRIFILVAAAMAVALAARAQEGHPLTGTWYGEYESAGQRRDITIVMKWDGKVVSGSINPGPASSPIKSAVLDITPGKAAPEGVDSTQGVPPVFRVRIEVDGITFAGTLQNPVAGNRRITGSWTRGNDKGTFQVRRL